MKQFRDTGYYVTEDGNVYSNKYGELRKIKQQSRNDYKIIKFRIDKKQYTFSVHRIVAECYIPNPNNLPEVDHRDCDKSNNHISNLEWVTRDENRDRAIKNGLLIKSEKSKIKMSKIKQGSKNPIARLSEQDIKWIRENYIPRDKKFGSTALSKKFGVAQCTISQINSNKKWKHL
jgi:hypothetical protein